MLCKVFKQEGKQLLGFAWDNDFEMLSKSYPNLESVKSTAKVLDI